jgi:hypothetical protein
VFLSSCSSCGQEREGKGNLLSVGVINSVIDSKIKLASFDEAQG